MKNSFYGQYSLNRLSLDQLTGQLIVIEGADGSGRSTQMELLTDFLEQKGYRVINVGIKRSTLVAEELNVALAGNTLSKRTMSLFYATDFADQMENTIIPALKAGFVVLCDRYIYTLIARSIVRQQSKKWLQELYSFSLKPDLIIYLHVNAENLVERNLCRQYCLDYWESGMDIGLSDDLFDSFVAYQKLMHEQYIRLSKEYGFEIIEGNQSVEDVFNALKALVSRFILD